MLRFRSQCHMGKEARRQLAGSRLVLAGLSILAAACLVSFTQYYVASCQDPSALWSGRMSPSDVLGQPSEEEAALFIARSEANLTDVGFKAEVRELLDELRGLKAAHEEFRRSQLNFTNPWLPETLTLPVLSASAGVSAGAAAQEKGDMHQDWPQLDFSTGGKGGAALRRQLCPNEKSVEDIRREAGQGGQAGLTWAPQKGRYLLATCVQGRISNRLRCFSRYLLAATLLRRTLVIPLADLNPRTGPWAALLSHHQYNLKMVISLPHLRACLGESSVTSLEELVRSRVNTRVVTKGRGAGAGGAGARVFQVNKALCWAKNCMFQGRGPRTMRGISFPRLKTAGAAAPKLTRQQFLTAFGGQRAAKVLTLGDLSMVEFSDFPRGLAAGLAEGWNTPCSLLLKPHAALIEAAQGFILEYTGARFAAVHLRRGDFYRYGVTWQRYAYGSLRQLAACLRRQLAGSGIALVFLATDAFPDQVRLFRELLSSPAVAYDPLAVVQLPPMEDKMWAEKLNRMRAADDTLAIATTEKLICSMAVAFFYTPGSSFSDHIRGLRRGLGLPTCRDGPLCDRGDALEAVPELRALARTTNTSDS